jgi:predicted nucleotidyltransferase
MRIQLDNELIREFCRRNHIRRLALFGSVLRDDFSPDSDVDVLLEFASGHTPDFFLLFEMEENLSKLLGGYKVDLVTAKSLNRRIRQRILDEAETLYAEG